MQHPWMRLALALPIAAMSACGSGGNGDDDTDPPVETDPIAPIVEILQPVPTGDYKVGEEVPLKAQVTDDDSAPSSITIVWRSSLDGTISEGNADADGVYIDSVTLESAGQHQILVEATDPDGEKDTASITISVSDLEPPNAYLDPAPTDLQEGDVATLTGRVSDAEDDPQSLFVAWKVDDFGASGTQPDASGNVRLVTSPLKAAAHKVTLTVTDQDGKTDTATIDVNVAACADFDRDGFKACGLPGVEVDCDDRDGNINPDAEEICGDDEDQDCDNKADEGFPDTDNDGVPDCVDECPYDRLNDRDNDGVCGDVDNCPTRANPGQEDLDEDGIGDECDDSLQELCDGKDNDGDTFIDEDFDIDTDGDGTIDCMDTCRLDPLNDADHDGVCGDVDNCPTTSNPLQEDENDNGVGDVCDFEVCDGEDNDRDGRIDEDFDLDHDGYPSCAVGEQEADCDDSDPRAYPGPKEICGDGDDNDCDGLVDLYEDIYEPNGSLGTAYDFGEKDDQVVELNATVFRETGTDSDFYKFIVDDDFAIGPDQFTFTAELSQIPPGVNLQLRLYYGTELVSEGTPGDEVQTVIRYGQSGPDDDAYAYTVEVKNLGGTTLEACQAYHLWVYNQG